MCVCVYIYIYINIYMYICQNRRGHNFRAQSTKIASNKF